MVIGVAVVRIHIPQSRSLKDKRSVVKPLLARVQQQLQIAAAEVEELDKLQLGVLGFACVSNDPAHADRMLAKAVSLVGARLDGAELLDYETEIIHAL